MSTKLTVPNNIRVKINGNSCVKTTLAPSTACTTTTTKNYGNKLSVNAEVVCDLPTPIITNGENNTITNASNGEKKVCL